MLQSYTLIRDVKTVGKHINNTLKEYPSCAPCCHCLRVSWDLYFVLRHFISALLVVQRYFIGNTVWNR
ncbi:hypothetical protein [Bacteroides helcogenes]|uniref:Uncharacterized protein n=1 Tax=Bacteroides helcogenes (strain ATCC 35417 / DSM 20613 / JCM 6297 / CCUG 15421 / P 36-108) TaxID=693979 RepID=E6SP77_BACT6|nr:hypothetical protein [Bacteroides helcogenes]ADV44834.1 hypothetical protein Bache_2899 [Bacteroides helcogenes P 36-108]MDY5239692.1 hypothetical protein [Bacteroides helcogenes]